MITLELKLTGLKLRGINLDLKPLDAYCDDLNIITNDLNDLAKIDQEVQQFEAFSGAILSRSKKSKVLGLGTWSKRDVWPLSWLSSEKSIKVFGIFIMDSYREMLNSNWAYRLQKFQGTVISWSSRLLLTLQQRIEIIRMFGLSRTYYVASILPIGSGYVKKFEKIIGKFIWRGSSSLLRIALDELKNQKSEGGLQLPCLSTMGSSLLSSQCIRLLKQGDSRYVCHLKFWLGELLNDLLPDTNHINPATVDSSYFCILGDCLATTMANGLLTSDSLRTLTNKHIYSSLADFPQPKVVREAATGTNYKPVWGRLHCRQLNAQERELIYLIIHNKLPVPERLFRIGIKNDPYCMFCAEAVVGDIEHYFCHCIKTRYTWSWVKTRLLQLSRGGLNRSNSALLSLFLPEGDFQHEMLWLVGKYVHYVWSTVQVKESTVHLEKFIGYLKFKFKNEESSLILHGLVNILGS